MRGGLQEADKAAALEHARAAIEAGADDAETLATAGFAIGLVAHDYETAMNAIERALKINATSALALASRRHYPWPCRPRRTALSNTPSGRSASARSIRGSPTAYTALGIAHCSAGNWEAVASACGKAIEANPRFSLPQVLQAAALSFLGPRGRGQSGGDAGAGVGIRLHREPASSGPTTGRAEIWEPIGDALRRLGLPE